MKYIIICLVILVSFSIAEKIDSPSQIVGENPAYSNLVGPQPTSQLMTPEIAELQKKMDEAMANGNYELARMYDRQIVDIRYPMPANNQKSDDELEAFTVSDNGSSPLPFFWGNDRLVRAGELRDFACDYDTNGTMYVAVSCPDSTIRLYRSTNHGLTWTHYQGWFHTTKDYYTKVGLVVTQGDSGFVHIYMRHRNNSGDLYYIRASKTSPGTSFISGNIGATADTINDFSICEDYYNNYYLYCLYANEQRSGTNAKFLRSLTYGRTWVDTTNWTSGFDPSISFVSYTNLVTACRIPPGVSIPTGHRIYFVRNTSWGHPTAWGSSIGVAADTFNAWEPCVAATNTRPDSAATVWILYTHNYNNSGDYDADYAYSTNGGRTFTTGQHLSWTVSNEDFADIRHYRIYPNTYVNACYTLSTTTTSNVYWTWANGPTPTAWSSPHTLVNDARASISLGGKLIYSPHSPGSGGAVVYPRYGPDSLFFDANWVGIEEQPPSNLNNDIITIQPNPFVNHITISYQITQPTRVSVVIYDAAGREVKSIINGNAEKGDYTMTWTGNDNQNRAVNNGIYFIRLKTDNKTTTQKLIYTK